MYVIKAEGGAKEAKKGREPKNQVHQEAILVETIRKELAQQKLFTNYSVNPFKKCNSSIFIFNSNINSSF